jgi:hypothetical protein
MEVVHEPPRVRSSRYRAIETAERARRAEREAQSPQRRPGPRFKVQVPLPQAEQANATAIAVYDLSQWLLGEIHQTLEPITVQGRLVNPHEARAALETALNLLKQLAVPDMVAFADDLHARLPVLLALLGDRLAGADGPGSHPGRACEQVQRRPAGTNVGCDQATQARHLARYCPPGLCASQD